MTIKTGNKHSVEPGSASSESASSSLPVTNQKLPVGGLITTAHKLSSEVLDSIQIVDKEKMKDILKLIDSKESFDAECEDLLLEICESFVDSVADKACSFSKHRGSKTLESKDCKLSLEMDWGII